MESILHKRYVKQRINGEWFGFTKGEIEQIYQSIPREVCIFWHLNTSNQEQTLASFSNIQKDIKVKNKPQAFVLSEDEKNYRRLLGEQKSKLNKLYKEAQLSFDF